MENNKFSANLVTGIVFVILGLFVVKYFNIAFPISVTTMSKSSEMAVVGEGKLDVIPDIAYIDAGITVEGKQTVKEVQDTIDTINNKIIEAMKNLGVKKTDIKTSNYSVSPSYDYDKGREITGYNGSATVQITVRNTQMASQVITEATKAGANQINGQRFTVDKPEKYREEVRNIAIQNAKDQAEKMAKSLGIKLGKVVNIIESAPSDNSVYKTSALPMSGGGLSSDRAVNIEEGSQTLTSTVTLYFEKK